MITAKQLANMLDGKDVDEFDYKILASEAVRSSNLIAVYGSGHPLNMNLRRNDPGVSISGAIDDGISEEGYIGGNLYITAQGCAVFEGDGHDCHCEFCGFLKSIEDSIKVFIHRNVNGLLWLIESKYPCEPFGHTSDGYSCRGIVIQIPPIPLSLFPKKIAK